MRPIRQPGCDSSPDPSDEGKLTGMLAWGRRVVTPYIGNTSEYRQIRPFPLFKGSSETRVSIWGDYWPSGQWKQKPTQGRLWASVSHDDVGLRGIRPLSWGGIATSLLEPSTDLKAGARVLAGQHAWESCPGDKGEVFPKATALTQTYGLIRYSKTKLYKYWLGVLMICWNQA